MTHEIRPARHALVALRLDWSLPEAFRSLLRNSEGDGLTVGAGYCEFDFDGDDAAVRSFIRRVIPGRRKWSEGSCQARESRRVLLRATEQASGHLVRGMASAPDCVSKCSCPCAKGGTPWRSHSRSATAKELCDSFNEADMFAVESDLDAKCGPQASINGGSSRSASAARNDEGTEQRLKATVEEILRKAAEGSRTAAASGHQRRGEGR